MSEKLNLSAPWITYKNEIEAMFGKDPDITIRYDDEQKEVRLYVTKPSKASALEKILKPEQTFGNITVHVTVVPPNDNEIDILDTFDDAFLGNPSLCYTVPIQSPLGTHRFAVFQNKVVQFYNDQMDDLNGNKSTLFQEIAKDIFKEGLSVNYCTDPGKDALTKPLGEWP